MDLTLNENLDLHICTCAHIYVYVCVSQLEIAWWVIGKTQKPFNLK
uniref:Uncharacterized protein n=1 Tax=Anguilla anguilla TaxID=7936 RepID=A0A0E9RF07_ANGAN